MARVVILLTNKARVLFLLLEFSAQTPLGHARLRGGEVWEYCAF